MFDKAFKPFITKQDCTGPKDPIDQCIQQCFHKVLNVSNLVVMCKSVGKLVLVH